VTGLHLRLAYREPIDVQALLRFLATRAVAGVEEFADGVYRRTLRLPHAAAVVSLQPGPGYVSCHLHLDDPRDLTAAVRRCRWLFDLDADPVAVDGLLGADPVLQRVVARRAGRRVPHTVDGTELAVRAVLGQQVSVAGARTLAGRLVQRFGKPLTAASGGLTHVFPEAAVLADADLRHLGLPARRAATINVVAHALADRDVILDAGADRDAALAGLAALTGVGPWTVSYIAMRALGDPDAFPGTDLGLRKAAAGLGLTPAALDVAARNWRPWRSYAAEYLWSTLEQT
jgi:AraC family transcriptional regulator of adaptative response / DNA-3-methyladenine glycosylase II